MIVDSINKCLIAPDEVSLTFTNSVKLYFYYKSEMFVEGPFPKSNPISLSELSEYDRVWGEPISTDYNLRLELRGWYIIMSDWVENSAGNRFSNSTYMAKNGLSFKKYKTK